MRGPRVAWGAFISCLAVVPIYLMIGCGDGGGDPAIKTGVFVDSPVEGINYTTATQSGVTNAQGEFLYIEGETVTFSIGDADFPNATAAPTVSPFDLAGTTDVTDTTVINMARLLQTLDTDGDPDNGITIGAQAHTEAIGMSIDFDSATFDSDVSSLVANSGSVNTTLVDGVDAVAHLANNVFSVVGGWDMAPAGFDTHILAFYPNGYYFQWNDADGATLEGFEIGTYTCEAGQLTITSHIVNGPVGFDDPDPYYAINLTATTLDFTGMGASFVRLEDETKPIVGAWSVGGEFDPAAGQVIVFYPDGHYFQWNDVDGDTPEGFEIGTYTCSATQLTITSHIVNGPGGFDHPDNPDIPPADPYNIVITDTTLEFTDLAGILVRVK